MDLSTYEKLIKSKNSARKYLLGFCFKNHQRICPRCGGRNLSPRNDGRSRWFDPVLRQNLLNYATLPRLDSHRRRFSDETGYEYLIIAPDEPDFIAWADTLK